LNITYLIFSKITKHWICWLSLTYNPDNQIECFIDNSVRIRGTVF
jgi:hypothetical protein